MAVVIVAGALANKYRNGGEAWVRMSWVRGLRALGADALFVEQIAPRACVDDGGAAAAFEACANRDYFRRTVERMGLAGRAALVLGDGEACDGMAWDRLLDVAASADLLINVSGHLTLTPLLSRVRRTAYVDIDPGYTQAWHADPATPFALAPHDFYYTIGENVGRADCPIPTGGIEWRPTRQPVVLDDWPVAPVAMEARFTTVASWRGAFGPVAFGGRTYGVKAHEFRRVIELPRLARERVERALTFELALDIYPGDTADRAALEANGWALTDPRAAAGDADAFRAYVRGSAAEFSVAQGVYVHANSGWFSDRTTRYLASGRPAVVQETGFSRNIASGEGLVAFNTPEEAAEGVRRVVGDYAAHCEAARAVAEKYFDANKVLPRLLEETGVR